MSFRISALTGPNQRTPLTLNPFCKAATTQRANLWHAPILFREALGVRAHPRVAFGAVPDFKAMRGRIALRKQFSAKKLIGLRLCLVALACLRLATRCGD